MKFLIDECLSVRLAATLCAYSHDAIHVTDRGLNGKSDTDVMALAVAENRIVISADTDFGELLAASGTAAPSLILLRGFGGRPDTRIRVILANLAQLEEYLRAGAIVVINERRIRIRLLPIEPS